MIEIRRYNLITGKEKHITMQYDEFAQGHIAKLNATVKHGYFYGVRIFPAKRTSFSEGCVHEQNGSCVLCEDHSICMEDWRSKNYGDD